MPQSFLSHKQCKKWIKLECLTYLVQPRSRRNNNKNLLVLTVQPFSTLTLKASTLVATLFL